MSWPILWLAIIGCGGVAVGTNPSYTSSELAHHFNVAGPKYCIVQSECLQAVEAAIAACNIPPPHIFTLCGANQTSPEGKQPWQSLTLYGECEWDTNTIHHKSIADKPAALNSTSGTTGLPKAAVVTHCFVVAQTSMVEQRFKNKPYQVCSLFPRCHLSMLTLHDSPLNSSVYLSSMLSRHKSPLSCPSVSESQPIFSPDITHETSRELSTPSRLQKQPSFHPLSPHCCVCRKRSSVLSSPCDMFSVQVLR